MKKLKDLLNDPLMWLALYLVIAINTFGHAWASISTNPQANDAGIMIGSWGCAIFWPLYWSVKFWS